MNISLLLDLILGFGVSFFDAQGRSEVSDTLKKLQMAKDAGANVEAHMQRIADALLTDVPLDWESLAAEINSEVDEFLARPT